MCMHGFIPEIPGSLCGRFEEILTTYPDRGRYRRILDFSYAGKQLANLHLNYEEIPAYEGVTVIGDRQRGSPGWSYDCRNYGSICGQGGL